ncbi:hypothetical protein RJ641_017005 [Dillenia turbinata]|uniref:Uncharacterized protein n=1 Tax=Dillenia turbinata TaxID=194707 RepID=A0AAN8UZF3_9MAGN
MPIIILNNTLIITSSIKIMQIITINNNLNLNPNLLQLGLVGFQPHRLNLQTQFFLLLIMPTFIMISNITHLTNNPNFNRSNNTTWVLVGKKRKDDMWFSFLRRNDANAFHDEGLRNGYYFLVGFTRAYLSRICFTSSFSVCVRKNLPWPGPCHGQEGPSSDPGISL